MNQENRASVPLDAVEQYQLGLSHAWGMGAPQDFTEAAKWFRAAAKNGDARSQYNLGVTYLSGQGVEQNHDEARGWFGEAAAQGNAKAADWFTLAAQAGDALAQHNLGLMYRHGLGIERNAVSVHAWLSLAAGFQPQP